MQPPPQAVVSGVAGPPPAGNPRSMFWANSPYRRPANNNVPAAPITRPLQPVTDPFAFNRQTLQNAPVGNSSRSSLPTLLGPALSVFSQWPGLPVPPTGDSSTVLHEPLSGTLSQPRADTSPFPPASTPSSLPGLEMNRSAEVGSSSGSEVQMLPHPPHYIPGVGPEQPHRGHLNDSGAGPDQPMNRHAPHDLAQAASPFFPQPQMPGQWGPVQGGSQPSYQHHLPCLEGPVQNMGPQAASLPHFPSPSSLHQGPGHEPHVPLMSTSASVASGEGNEVVHQQSKSHSLSSFPSKHTFEQNSRVGNMWTSPEFKQNPGVNKEHLPDPAHVNPLTQGNSPENQVHCPAEAATNHGLQEAASGALSMFFQGEETENEENLSSEKAGLDDRLDLDGFSSTPRLGHPPPPPAHGSGGIYPAFLKGPSSEAAQQEGGVQPYFSQSMGIRHDKQTTMTPASDMWGDTSGTGTHCASGPQCENVENLEFVQNQEVLPRETLNVDPSSLSDQFRYGPVPGPAVSRPVTVGLTRGGGLNLEAPDIPLHPTRPDSVSSSYSSHSHRSPPGSARPQELVGTFIQQEVGKLEDDTSGSFFKQIDSSPVGGETGDVTGSQNYCSSLSQPSTPSPPKPTGVFQTSANSSFEPVKSHLVGVKQVEADRANVVVEVRGTRDRQKKRRAVVPPDATPGNLEQPPDNMETLCTSQTCPLPLSTTGEAGHLVSHTAGPPLDTVRPMPEKRPSARTQGPVKCESPATTLWAQNELPDFGGNVLLAPAAPALYVPVKPKPSEVVHPEKGVSGQQSQKPGSMPSLQNQDPPGTSENLENPPKVGEEEDLPLQVTKDAQDLYSPERTQPELVPPRPRNSSPQVPQAVYSEPSNPESPPIQGQSESLAQPPASPAPVNMGQQPLPQPPQSSSASTSSSQAAVRSEQPWLHPPPPNAFGPAPQDLASYYYYRPLYDAYQSQYPSPYPSDPGTASLYYQDIYGLYEPRYRPYDSSASAYAENHRYSEPERPSSRASHYSDQLTLRQGYPEGYYKSKSGWSSQSDYYANYYPSQYDYGDPGRWDHYYGSRFRDPRTWDRRYWYDSEHDPYRKDNYAYSDRPEKCDDHWRYDPRFTGSFDDDTELHRDPYGEEVDRRSIHSEHSARSLRSTHSLPSRRSSLSSHSHQSQIYRSHNVTGSSFEAPHAPGSFHGDYAYGTYASNFSGAHGFPEYSYPADTSWPAVEQVPSRPTSPEKYTVPHVCARFGPGGQLLKVIPNLPSEGQPALVEIHSLETLLQHTPEQEEMRSFPGPLGKDDTHKVDVINFAQNKATKCLQNESLIDKESASLLWNFIILLCRQNGTVVGTDIAELLLRDHRTVWLPGKSPNEANLIDFTNDAMEQVEEEESGEAQLSFLTDSQTATTTVLEKETERFRELLLYGRKKDALESAMKNGLWGHALLLASKMDSRTHARVMTRFANSLPINDPLQTVYQLMSGRMPAASTCCGDEKWGDWRPHLAMVLSNLNNNMDVESRTMATMGDTLASKGLLDAAHFCYLMAQVGFGVYTKKTTKLVLIGSNHSLPFLKFATNEAIQRTEAYEYAQSLGAHTCSLPNFQVFKFIYLCRLAEMGLATQAFHYCEVIAKSVLTQPGAYSPVLISQLTQMASQLRLFDPQLKEKPEEESFVEPAWLVQLRHVERQIQEGTVLWSQDGTDPPQCPSSEVEQLDGPELSQQAGLRADNPLLMTSTEPLMHSIQLLPTAPQTFPDGQPAHFARVPMFPMSISQGPLELGPAYGPPGSALGFPESSRSDPAVLHPGLALPPITPCLQESGPPLQEARSPDPEMVPRGSPVRHLPPERNEEESGGNFTDLGSSRAAQDLETPPAWDHGSSSLTPAPSATPASEGKKPVKKEAKEPKKSESWFSRWLPGKKRTEAYLPDDKNKSIVWDEKKNQWVNLNEPEEEKKAPPPPPTSFPRVPQVAPTGPAGPPTASVNMFSRKAGGTRARYVDVLNPSGTQRSEPALAPADFFTPLAPLPIPSNLFVPNPDAEEPQSGDGAGCREQAPAGTLSKAEPTLEPKMVSSAASLPGPELSPSKLDGSQGGEASGDHCPAGPTPGGSVPFYNPAQLVQASITSGNSRPGRIGQRKYAALN